MTQTKNAVFPATRSTRFTKEVSAPSLRIARRALELQLRKEHENYFGYELDK